MVGWIDPSGWLLTAARGASVALVAVRLRRANLLPTACFCFTSNPQHERSTMLAYMITHHRWVFVVFLLLPLSVVFGESASLPHHAPNPNRGHHPIIQVDRSINRPCLTDRPRLSFHRRDLPVRAQHAAVLAAEALDEEARGQGPGHPPAGSCGSTCVGLCRMCVYVVCVFWNA